MSLRRDSNRFFLAFHRYISTSIPTQTRHVHKPTPHHPLHLISPSPRRYVTTATSTSISQPTHDPPRPRTHYDLFPTAVPNGPPPSGPFTLDLSALKREFLQLQARAHPDRHSGPDKARAEGTSALINEAYKTLQDPLRRAQYLLQLQGIDVAEDETLKIEDPELLMEVLEAREAIEGAQEEGELEGMKEVNEENIRKSVELLEEAFNKGDMEGAKSEAVRLRYWTNIKESLHAWEKGKPVVLVH
ncbi:hypothetical protein G7Y79_00069g096400 [Physcia stellaris]|nr:hypothetical protein G7Y79_00069g096400 [Physcia stellaris]